MEIAVVIAAMLFLLVVQDIGMGVPCMGCGGRLAHRRYCKYKDGEP